MTTVPAVVLTCPDNHKEVTLKTSWHPRSHSHCARCGQPLRIEREGTVTDRTKKG